MSLEIHNVTKYFGEQCVLSDFSYSFPDRGLFYLTGDSGRGKTTLLRIIAGLDRDFTGSVTGNASCSLLFQDKRLFSNLTALENVAIINEKRGCDRAAVREAAAELLLSMKFTEEDLSKRPQALSGGMQQRTAIARAVFYPADILLLDEPFKELDKQNRDILSAVIIREAEKRLVIGVSHEADDPARNGAVLIPL